MPCPSDRRPEGPRISGQIACGGRKGAGVLASGSQRQHGFLGGIAETRAAGVVLFSWALGFVLLRANGGDESDCPGDRGSWRFAGGDLSPDGEAILLHGRSAPAALSAFERCGKPGGPAVWIGLSPARRAAGHL